MKFQSVDIYGEIHIERVNSKPTWEAKDEGRLIYVKSEKILYYGTNETWVRSTGFGFRPVVVDKHYTAEEQDLCLVDTRNGPVVITFPPRPKSGCEIRIIDVAGSFESNPCTVQRNGKSIQRQFKNLVLDINDFTGTFTFDRIVDTWKVSIEGIAQVVGNATIFIHSEKIVSQNINGSGGQKQFTFKFKYNIEKENIAVYIDGVKQYYYEKTNVNSITFDETVPAGSVVEVVSIPIEAGFNIDKFVNISDLDNYVQTSHFIPNKILELIKDVDGSGSGLDADLLDGRHGNSFVYTENYKDSDILNKIKKVDGTDSGLDADLLDGWHAVQDITKDKKNKIPVTRNDGILDPIWLPFGRGGFEFYKKFNIQGNPVVVDIMDLTNPEGYLIQLNNITPSTSDVKLYLRFYNSVTKAWTGISYWTILYTNHLSGGLRDFNTDSDMLLADHIGNGNMGITGFINLSGFGSNAVNTIKTVRGDFTHLSSIESFSSLSQSVGTFNRNYANITGVRLYFNYGTFMNTGYVNVMKINEKN